MLFTKQYFPESRYLDEEEFRRKFCGCMSLRGGCAIACAVWIGVNTYIATLAFRGYTPIFSYLNRPCLYVLGSLSIVFGLIAFLVLYGLFENKPYAIERAFYPLMLIIFIYLIDVIVNIFFFGIQKPAYMDWCIGSSHNRLDEIVDGIARNGTMFEISDLPIVGVYNCQKLWEDELKFSLVIFLIMLFCYIYWGACVFFYYEKMRDLFYPQAGIYNNGGFMNALYQPSRFLYPMFQRR